MSDILTRLAEWRDASNVRMEVRTLAADATSEIERLTALPLHLSDKDVEEIIRREIRLVSADNGDICHCGEEVGYTWRVKDGNIEHIAKLIAALPLHQRTPEKIEELSELRRLRTALQASESLKSGYLDELERLRAAAPPAPPEDEHFRKMEAVGMRHEAALREIAKMGPHTAAWSSQTIARVALDPALLAENPLAAAPPAPPLHQHAPPVWKLVPVNLTEDMRGNLEHTLVTADVGTWWDEFLEDYGQAAPPAPPEDRWQSIVDERGFQTGWVIELGETSPSRPAYWIGPSENPAHWPFGMWSDDNAKAVRFARKEDAEAVVKFTVEWAHNDPRAVFRVADHAWDYTPRTVLIAEKDGGSK